MASKDDIIADLRELVKSLAAEVADLKLQLAKARKDSTTSSMAPSSDITGAGKKKNKGPRTQRNTK